MVGNVRRKLCFGKHNANESDIIKGQARMVFHSIHQWKRNNKDCQGRPQLIRKDLTLMYLTNYKSGSCARPPCEVHQGRVGFVDTIVLL